MGEKPGEMKSDRIKRDIDLERNDLGRNIQQLEQRVKSELDWRAQFQKYPMAMLGLAFGGGVLLSAILGDGGSPGSEASRWRGPDYRDYSGTREEQSQGTSYQKHRALDMWDNIKGAVIGVAATRFRTFLDETIPGFSAEYSKTEREKAGA